MRSKQLKEWTKHLISQANKCDNPIIKAFILGKADTAGLEYLARNDGDEDFRDLLLCTNDDYYIQWDKWMDEHL